MDYTKHISNEMITQGSTTILPENETEILKNIASALFDISKQNKLSFSISVSNYHVWYSFNTTSTTKTKIDIVKDLSTSATELYVVSSGGGFDIELNDEGNRIRVSDGMRIYNEIISRIYITGYGNSGIGKLRFGVSK